MEHGGFAVEGLAQIEGTVLGLVVRGAAASGLAAAAGHYDEAAVEEAFGLREELVEFAAALALLRRQGGWTDGLAGNVYEWCWDWHGTPYAGGTDPHGAATGSDRVLRGGSWDYYAISARCAYRNYFYPGNAFSDGVGFRAVQPPGQ